MKTGALKDLLRMMFCCLLNGLKVVLIMKMKKILNDKNLLVIKYENFLNNFDEENNKICNFLKIKKN